MSAAGNDIRPKYKKLRCKTRSVTPVSNLLHRLYLGDDHLLYYTGSSYAERYKRFYFNEIQALTYSQNRKRSQNNIILGVIALLFLLLSAAIVLAFYLMESADMEFGYGLALGVNIGTLVVLVLIAANTLRGPTCTTEVHTAVQRSVLKTPDRVRQARRLFATLIPIIEEAQGRVSREEIIAQAEAASVQPEPSTEAVPATPVRPLRVDYARAHEIYFWLLLADVVHSGMYVFWAPPILMTIGGLIGVSYLCAILVALVAQRNSTIPDSLRTLTWISGGYMMVAYCVGVAMAISETFTAVGEGLDPMSTALQPGIERPGILVFLTVSIFINVVLAVPGLFMVYRYRRELRGGEEAEHRDASTDAE